MGKSLDELAELVRSALSTGDLESYGELIAPNAHWGPADAPQWGCQNRKQILNWYRTARNEGMNAVVNEVVAGTDSLLVGLTVRGRGPDAETGPRWQVLKVQDGLVIDICGFETREEAAARAGVAGH